LQFLEQRLAAVTESAANLIAQLRELHELREQIRKAQLSAGRRRLDRENKVDFKKPAGGPAGST
jgi:hypothetical protein